jgi:hypothetical protein
MGSPIEPSLNRYVPLGTAKPTECDRSDTEKGCYQVMAEEVFVVREIFAKPRKSVSAAKCRKTPLSLSLTGQFLLQNTVCPFANGLGCQHKLSQSTGVHVRNQGVCNHIY